MPVPPPVITAILPAKSFMRYRAPFCQRDWIDLKDARGTEMRNVFASWLSPQDEPHLVQVIATGDWLRSAESLVWVRSAKSGTASSARFATIGCVFENISLNDAPNV